MIIKSKPLSPFFFNCVAGFIGLFLKWRFNKMIIKPINIKPGHSYILMCNHFGFLDGLLAFYLCNKIIRKKHGMQRLYIMSVKKQMEKNRWLQYIGSFSIDPGKRSIHESFEYAAEILNEPGNLLLFYPQGELESSHIRHIKFEEGLLEIVSKIKGDTQLIWSSNLIEYFESVRPSVYFNMLDCGTNHDFNFEQLQKQVNKHHLNAIKKNIRYTIEPANHH
jgi:1-acyl-sn-glycerol-3-phosphate acyltransferase